ncbi:MAG: type II toxin-antitoxin system HicA family toxin [Actinobacteria bacterium]|nr:type II toxin-antitoxin system HicA family toxin [Actinomycetota bacterium]
MPKKYRQVRVALISAGWTKVRQSGSHETWSGPTGHGRVIVAGKNSDTVPGGILASIRRNTGVEDLR